MNHAEQELNNDEPVGTVPDLFTPIRLGALTLPNRIVMAPMTRNRAGAGNVPSELNVKYYAQRAAAGLIITEATQVSPQGVGYPDTPGIHTEEQVAGWRRVVDAVHAQGGFIYLQLWHVGRISHPSLQPNGDLPVAPSAIRPRGQAMTYAGLKPFVTPRALAIDEIPGIVAQFRLGAENARAAGFDGVEIHSANGYLLDQFLRDGTNRRTDRYGGSVEYRARLPLEVLESVLDIWPADRVGIRLSPSSVFNDMQDFDPRRTFGYIINELDRYRLAYVHLIEPEAADFKAGAVTVPTREFRSRYQGYLMANGNYDRHSADLAIANGKADLVSFGKKFLANPDLPRRLWLNAPLNEPDPATFYGGTEVGYTDYPALTEKAVA